ncbi:hypothetical protein V8G54_005704 [Vigna mungo]|uniref:Uncharacterized protein n=1 Tax=Vigna mungo TaxID=3915 RepID=A0AAQ3P0W3_VIGMU
MKLFEVTPFWLSNVAIFIKRSIIIICSGDIWTSSSSTEISPSMVHVIILECASGLEKSSHRVGNIFGSPVWIFATPILEPTNPVFGPHFRTIRIIGFKVVTVPTIASIDHWLRSIGLLTHDPWNSNVQ